MENPVSFRYALDEITARRLQKEASSRAEINGLANVHRLLSSLLDCEALAQTDGAAAEGDKYRRRAEAFRISIQERLRLFDDLHEGLDLPGVHRWTARYGFEQVWKGKNEKEAFFIWAHPDTGVVLTGSAWGDSLNFPELRLCFQWAPVMVCMSEADEDVLLSQIDKSLGSFEGGFFNPLRPGLSHTRLHLASSYPQLTRQEQEALIKGDESSPASINAERGGWILCVDAPVRAGVKRALSDLSMSVGGKIATKWESGWESFRMAVNILLRDHNPLYRSHQVLLGLAYKRYKSTAPWFQEMIARALSLPQRETLPPEYDIKRGLRLVK